MKQNINPYHYDLISDPERLAGFYEAIEKKAKGIVYDIGTGSGIFAEWASDYADFVYAIEIDQNVAERTRSRLKSFKNIKVITGDATDTFFLKNADLKKADLIICEMLDTALIDEEQVPVLNSVMKYLKEDGEIIPYGVINCVEPVQTAVEHICYEEFGSPKNEVLGDLRAYSMIQFKEDYRYPSNRPDRIKEYVDTSIDLKINSDGMISGIKLTTFTLITPEIICGPTPMLNSPLIIPTNRLKVNKGDNVKINLSYIMGGGLNSIKTSIEKVPRE